MTSLTADAGTDIGSLSLHGPRLAWRRTFYDTKTDFVACNPNGEGGARVSRVGGGPLHGLWTWRASAARKIADGVAPSARSAAVAAEDAMGRNALGEAAVGETGDGYPVAQGIPAEGRVTPGIGTSRELLAVLREDHAAFRQEPTSARLALHCAVTAYHMHEWISHEFLEPRVARLGALRGDPIVVDEAGEPVSSNGLFRSWCTSRFPRFSILGGLADGSKHLRFGAPDTGEVVGRPPSMFDAEGGGVGRGVWDGPMPYDPAEPDVRFLSVEGSPESGESCVAMSVLLDEAVAFWDRFFEERVP